MYWTHCHACTCAVQGVLQLLEKSEIRDVLATAGVEFEQLKRLGRFGGVVLQLQGMMQKGFKTVCCSLSPCPTCILYPQALVRPQSSVLPAKCQACTHACMPALLQAYNSAQLGQNHQSDCMVQLPSMRSAASLLRRLIVEELARSFMRHIYSHRGARVHCSLLLHKQI